MHEVEWESCLLEPIPAPKLEQRFRRETGRPGRLMRFFEGSNWLSDAVVRLSVQLNTHVHVDAEFAVEAALAMREALAAYNQKLAAEGLPSLSIGIGLHRGTGVAGVVGSAELKEFAFIGRTVNVAARAQDLTRSFPADIILTESVRRTLDRRFALSALPETAVKGVEKPLSIFALEGRGG